MKDSFKPKLLIYYVLASNMKEYEKTLCFRSSVVFNYEQVLTHPAMHDRIPDTFFPLSSFSLSSSLQISCSLEGLVFIMKTFLNHLTTERFRVQNLTGSEYNLI